MAALADPTSDSVRVLEVYSLRQKALLDTSEVRTASAVKSVDDCNGVNAQVALQVKKTLQADRPWWHVWP